MFTWGTFAKGGEKVTVNRHFCEEIKFRVTYEQKQQILAAAQSQNKVVSDFYVKRYVIIWMLMK